MESLHPFESRPHGVPTLRIFVECDVPIHEQALGLVNDCLHSTFLLRLSLVVGHVINSRSGNDRPRVVKRTWDCYLAIVNGGIDGVVCWNSTGNGAGFVEHKAAASVNF
mgnify:CR=1 FL=1